MTRLPAAVGVLLTLLPSLPAVAQESRVRIVNDESSREFVVTIGPVDLPAHGDHGHGAGSTIRPPVQLIELPLSVHLYGFSYDVVDESGRAVPRDVIHHINVINPDSRELFLPISQRLLAVGRETGDQSMPGWLLGVPVSAGMRLAVAAVLHNPTGEPHPGVTVRLRLRYVESRLPLPLFEVYPFHIDVQFPVGDVPVDLPPGRSRFSYEASPAIEGRIMVIGSHLHEYATSIRFEDVTEAKVLWEGHPERNANGELIGVTIGRLYWKLGLKIHPDHLYRVTVSYDNPTADTLIGEGMGVVAGAFIPSRGASWPSADQDDEIYALDRQYYMRKVPMTDPAP